MKELIPYLIGMIVSSLIFMNISIKFRWSEQLWNILNKKINSNYSAALWILIVVFIQGVVQLLCEGIGITSITSKIVLGFIMGFYFAFMPDLGKNKR